MFFRRIFLIFSTFSFVFLFLASLSFAYEEKSPNPTPTPTPPKKIDYSLPYPGILPDHPLYFLKEIRDRILETFISDPLKKAEFYLLMADKRLNNGLFLLEKGKIDLAEKNLVQSEKYLDQALNTVQKAKEAGKNTDPLISRLSLATLKHQEVLDEILEKVPDQAKPGIRQALEKSQKGMEQVREMQRIKLEMRLQERKFKGTVFAAPAKEERVKNGK